MVWGLYRYGDFRVVAEVAEKPCVKRTPTTQPGFQLPLVGPTREFVPGSIVRGRRDKAKEF